MGVASFGVLAGHLRATKTGALLCSRSPCAVASIFLVSLVVRTIGHVVRGGDDSHTCRVCEESVCGHWQPGAVINLVLLGPNCIVGLSVLKVSDSLACAARDR